MKIGLYHGYELMGSGSNEYTRYLAAALAAQGHEVHVICREPDPVRVAGVDAALAWETGEPVPLFGEPGGQGTVTVHRLAHAAVRPVYVADKQREGDVRTFVDLADDDLAAIRSDYADSLRAVLSDYPVDILHANHVVLQPTIAADVCRDLGIPFVVYPHGSDIEYTVRHDDRYLLLARDGLLAADGVISGSGEMRQRLARLYPDIADELAAKSEVIGVGVDTALFHPRERGERAAAIRDLLDTRPGGGKPARLSAELGERIDRGDIEAVIDYRRAYTRDLPDDTAAADLAGIPWQTGKVVLSVGALTVGKGVQSLIAAWPQVLASVPDAHLVIVGSGSYREVLEGFTHAVATGNADAVSDLVANGVRYEVGEQTGGWPDVAAYLADPVGRDFLMGAGPVLADRIHFIGRMDHDRLNLLFPCCDLAVFPSVVPEAYPLVLMESLSCGVLPAASDAAGLGDGLQQLVPHLGEELVDRLKLPMADDERVAGIANNIVALLTDPGLSDLGPKLRAIAVGEYDWSQRAQAMVEAYRRFSNG